MNTGADTFPWGDNPFTPNHWHQLHELWLYMAPAEREFTISYCYGRPGQVSKWLQFSAVTDLRYPLATEFSVCQRLATRPMVARPSPPVHVPAETSATLYVGTSLWLALLQGDNSLLDLPVAWLSDTWFGPDTRNGEICYACQTHARLSMEGVPANPWKAITPVKIRNRSGEALSLDRINLPVPNLTLYEGEDRYWTSRVTITRRSGLAAGEVEISKEAPQECLSPVELAPPRQPRADTVWHKATDLLLG